MGREVRKVPADWQHPKDERTGRYIALFDGAGFASRLQEWNDESDRWNRGEFPSYAAPEDREMTYSEWAGEQPNADDYMPVWPDSERTHFMMYESTSEGTPISPAFSTPEELARWLADSGASAFAYSTASYESWLRVARGGYACSAVSIDGGPLVSGVEGLTEASP